MTFANKKLLIARIREDFPIADLENEIWNSGESLAISNNWDGSSADAGRQFRVSALRSDAAAYIRFDAAQAEPLVINDNPDTDKKTIGLWDRDVCEFFIAPNKHEPGKYFEFEVAPTGEWLDLAIDSNNGERATDWNYCSGMETAAKIEEDRVVMAMKIRWKALGGKPKAGDVWLGNIFRCVGKEPDRGYLAWQPTFTEKPDFHVPEAFGEFRFVG